MIVHTIQLRCAEAGASVDYGGPRVGKAVRSGNPPKNSRKGISPRFGCPYFPGRSCRLPIYIALQAPQNGHDVDLGGDGRGCTRLGYMSGTYGSSVALVVDLSRGAHVLVAVP